MLTTRRTLAGIRLALMLSLLFMLLSSWPADAEESGSIGRIIAIRGQATAVDEAGGLRTLVLKSEIRRGELIRTDQRCRLQIMFADNTIVSLGPASEFQVKDYAWDAEKGQGKMTSRVNEGVFRVLGGSITKSAPQNFLTETPSATIGIRGSMYAGRLRGGELQVVFQGGKGIFVKNAFGSVDITTPGFGTRLAGPNLAPVKPFKVPVAELEKLDPMAAPAGEKDLSAGRKPAAPGVERNAEKGGEGIAADHPAPGQPNPAPEAGPIVARTDDNQPSGTSIPEWEEVALLEYTPTDTRQPGLEPLPLPVDPNTIPNPDEAIDPTPPQQDQQPPPDSPPPPPPDTSPDGTTTPPPPPPPPPPSPDAVVSGRFMAVEDNNDEFTGPDTTWLGTLSGATTAGTLSTVADTDNGTLIIDDLPVHVYSPTTTYTGDTKLQGQLRNVDLLGSSYQFNTADVASDNAGEFAVFLLDDLFNTTYSYRELGFAGTPTQVSIMPTTDVYHYHGPLLVTLDSQLDTGFESASYGTEMFVNWHSGKVLGVIRTPDPMTGAPTDAPGFFFGDVSPTNPELQLSNVKFVGMDVVALDPANPGPGPGPGPDLPLAIDGTTSFAQFYGNQTQGLGLVANGTTIDVQSQIIEELWQITAAGFRDPTTYASATGTSNWQGFAVGIGEDMNMIDVNRRLYMNLNPADFSLTINRDSGTISGSMTLTDQADPSAMIENLQIGGGNGSAYIFDVLFAAGLGGSTPITVSPVSGPLKPYGNYLITEDPGKQQPPPDSYTTWGTWEIAYSEPGSGKDYHVHNPGTLWVAGQPTSATDLATLATNNVTGTYSGMAEGVVIPPSGAFEKLPSGTFDMTVDFGTSMLTSGNISFPAGNLNPAVNFNIDPISIPGNGFAASISTPYFGTVNGAFFGPAAKSVAGNFDAQDTALRYIGIFRGDR